MRWIYKLEYKFGRYYIRNLMAFVIGGMVLVYFGDSLLSGGVSGYLFFSRTNIFAGQIWRVVSFIFLPPGGGASSLFTLISIYFIYMAGRFFEHQWGGFRLMLYYIIGILMAVIGGLISPLGFSTNTYLNSSLYLALATLMPDMQIRLFFVVPIKGWWFVLLFFAYNVYTIIDAFFTPGMGFLLGVNALILFAFSLVNYFLFLGPTLAGNLKQQMVIRRNRRQWRNRNK
jgi:hypothetical protein